jgi:hypothetical protein
MAVNTDLDPQPVVDRGQPTPEAGKVSAASTLPNLNFAGTMNIPSGDLTNGIMGNMPNALGILGLNEGDLVKQYQATQAGQDMLAADAARQQRLAAYKAANPNASDFQANFYSKTPEEQATFRAMYPGEAGGKAQGTSFTGAAPEAGQSMFDYMLANNGATPETKLNEGPGFGQALLTAALLAGGGLLTGGALNALMAGGGLGALFGGGAAGAAGGIIPSTVAGLIPTSTALGAGSAAGALGATLGTAATTAGLGTLGAALPSTIPATVAGLVPTSTALGAGSAAGQLAATLAGTGTAGLAGSSGAGTLLGGAAADTLAPTVSELVITAGAGGMSPAVAAALGLGGAAAGTLLSGSPGSTTTPGSQASGTPDDYTLPEETLVPATSGPTPPLIPPFALSPTVINALNPTINPNQPGLTTMPNVTLDPPVPPADDGTTVSELEVVAAKPTPVTPVLPGPKIDPFQPDLKTMPKVTLDPPPQPEPDVKTDPGKKTTTTTTTTDPTSPPSRSTTTIPTLKSYNPTLSSEPFNLSQFLSSMTSPRAGQANLGNVSPFSGGGVGPGAGPLDLKGSSAPDIYPWVKEAGG